MRVQLPRLKVLALVVAFGVVASTIAIFAVYRFPWSQAESPLVRTSPPSPADSGISADAGAPHQQRIWVHDGGVCYLAGESLECCGEDALGGLRVAGVRGVWMSLFGLCYWRSRGGRCLVRYGTQDDALTIPGSWRVETVVIGNGSICVLRAEGSVECRRLSEDVWRVAMPHADELDAGWIRVYALEAGDIWCWGEDEWGECPHEPGRITDVGDILTIAADSVHVCGIRRGGTILCWGGHVGGYGAPLIDGSDHPLPIEDLPPITWLRAAGFAAFCGGTDTPGASIHCWGIGDAPLIGLEGNLAVSADPWTFFRARPIPFDGSVVDLAGDRSIGCYLDAVGARTCRTTSEVLQTLCGAQARVRYRVWSRWTSPC